MSEIRLFKSKKDGEPLYFLGVRLIGELKPKSKINSIITRSGYSIQGSDIILLSQIGDPTKEFNWDYYDWRNDFLFDIHYFIYNNWKKDVIKSDSLPVTEIKDFTYKVKYLQVRDSGTNMPTIAIKFENTNIDIISSEIFLGFPEINSGSFSNTWDIRAFRTRAVSHEYIKSNWDTIEDTDVIDVEYILGISQTKKEFEW